VRLPFFYGWVVIAVAFVTMGVGVNARSAFSLLFPPILDEFGWERGLTAGVHGLPLMGSCDWNDGYNRVGHEGRGESVFDGWLLCDVLRSFTAIS